LIISLNADIDVHTYSTFTHFARFSYCPMLCLCEFSQHWAALCIVPRPYASPYLQSSSLVLSKLPPVASITALRLWASHISPIRSPEIEYD